MYWQFWGSVFFKENWGNCSRQHVPRGNYKFKLKLPPGLAAVAHLLHAACRHVNAPAVFLCFYFCGAVVALPVASRVNASLQFPTCWPMNGLFVHWSRGWGVLSFSECLVHFSSHGFAGHRTSGNQGQFKKPLVVVYYDVDYTRNPKGTNYWRNR